MSLFRRLFSKPNTRSEEANATTRPSIETPITNTTAVSADKDVVSTESPIKDSPDSVPSVADGVTRPLPPETVISSQNKHIQFGQSTDVGMVRSNNQDAALSIFFTNRSTEERPDFGLFIVADGMGGHHDGEKASALTVRVVAAHIANTVYLPILNQSTDEQPMILEAMVAAVQKANADILAKFPDGGTTLSAVIIVGNLAYIAHVGDSRAYLINKSGMEQLTRDHSLVQRLVELDQLTPEEAADYPQKNVLYRAIGQSEMLEVDTLIRRLTPSSRLLICSDGLWGQVEDREIFEVVLSCPNPQEACDKLVALANTHGGVDNITSILLKIPSN